ncbi:Fatty acyl-CoA reductase 2 [Bienertia sinuspersici]
MPNQISAANGGIGIINFLKNKSLFITGSTGFVAKVFVEKLLREVPDVKKIYLLIRAKTAEEAQQRLQSEIVDCEAFKRLKGEHGERYEYFMRSKLVAVAGNLCDPRLGMDEEQACLMADQIDVIVNSAGNTKWHDRYDVLLDVNARGLSRLIDYAVNWKKLILFLHVSTAFVSRESQGLVLEKPVAVGMEETATEKQSLNLKAIDIEAELKMVTALASSPSIPKDKMMTEMSKLSLTRAKFHGYHNAYQLTKAMGEMLLTKLSDRLSTVIIRPAFIEGSYRDPFHGWIEGYRGMDPMILFHGKGHLHGIWAEPTTILDVVPVDMVANAMITATAYHGILGKNGLHIYHVASSVVNPLRCKNMFNYSYNYFTKHPLITSRNEAIIVKDMEFYTSMDEYIMVGLDDVHSNDKLLRNLVRMAIIYGPAMFGKLQ